MSVLRVGILVLLLVASVWAVDTEVDTDNMLEADSEVDQHVETDAVHELKGTGVGGAFVAFSPRGAGVCSRSLVFECAVGPCAWCPSHWG